MRFFIVLMSMIVCGSALGLQDNYEYVCGKQRSSRVRTTTPPETFVRNQRVRLRQPLKTDSRDLELQVCVLMVALSKIANFSK